jgi:hypothetical protein
VHARLFPAFFLTRVAVQNVSLRYRKSRDPEGGSLGCAHAQPEVVQYPPYWGLLTGNDVTRRTSPGKYGSVQVRPGVPLGCSLGRPRLSFSSPGYLPLSHHFIFI